MSKHFWGAATVAGLLSSLTGSASLAKPPDLPLAHGVACPEAREESPAGDLVGTFDRVAYGVSADLQAAAAAPAPTVDAVVPCCVSLIVERVRRELVQSWVAAGVQVKNAQQAVAAAAAEPQPATPADEARHLYKIAERCRQQGDLDMARTCYQEVHLLAPTTRYGRLAMQRLHELEQTGLATEEQQEPVQPETTPRQEESRKAPAPEGRLNKQTTQQLGLVERSF